MAERALLGGRVEPVRGIGGAGDRSRVREYLGAVSGRAPAFPHRVISMPLIRPGPTGPAGPGAKEAPERVGGPQGPPAYSSP